MKRIPKDIRGRILRSGDRIALQVQPPPFSNGEERELEGYLFKRRGYDDGFVMAYFDESVGRFVSNKVYWRPETDIPFPPCKIIQRQKPSFALFMRNKKVLRLSRLSPGNALFYEYNGLRPCIDFIIKFFIIER